ncbi:MAG: ROK family protein [Planctomycetota bacterium]|nr:MAG: ROK family protein [Planctomycetota bacterium]
MLDNDGNAAAWGEWWAGVGRRQNDLVALTLGTGIGGGIVLDGRILHGHFENAAEIGHTIVVPGGRPCRCGQQGCLERYASASAVAERVREGIEAGRGEAVLEAVGSPDRVDARVVAEWARKGEPLCAEVWDEACRLLAAACVNIQHVLNPAWVVLGGGLAEAGALLTERVRAHLDRLVWRLHDDRPQIATASLGYDAGMIGAAALIWHEKETK